jgi:phage regulator Rha-like protein
VVCRGLTPQLQKGKIAVQKDLVTFQHNNQPVTTSHEIARLTGIPHDKVLRSVRTMERYYKELNKASAFERDFIVMTDEIIKATSGENSNPAKRGRPSIVYLLTKEGSLSFIGSLTGKKACEFRIAIADAFVRMERIILEQIPALEAENVQLRLENEQLKNNAKKQIAGPKTGMMPFPEMQENLFGEIEEVHWIMRPKKDLHPTIQAKAKARHLRKMILGLTQKFDELSEKIDLLEGMAQTKILHILTHKKDFDV